MACPVCFGDSSEPMALATNLGIWFMLGVVAVMLAAFASFFLYLRRQAIRAARREQHEPARAGQFAAGQEGTASC